MRTELVQSCAWCAIRFSASIVRCPRCGASPIPAAAAVEKLRAQRVGRSFERMYLALCRGISGAEVAMGAVALVALARLTATSFNGLGLFGGYVAFTLLLTSAHLVFMLASVVGMLARGLLHAGFAVASVARGLDERDLRCLEIEPSFDGREWLRSQAQVRGARSLSERFDAKTRALPFVGEMRPLARGASLVVVGWLFVGTIAVALDGGVFMGALAFGGGAFCGFFLIFVQQVSVSISRELRRLPLEVLGRAVPTRKFLHTPAPRNFAVHRGASELRGGVVRQAAQTLVAPSSGERCVAYRVALLEKDPRLDDTVVVPFMLECDDGETYFVDARDVVLLGEPRPVALNHDALQRLEPLLGSRGLTLANFAGARLAEAVLVAGDRVQVAGRAHELGEVYASGFRGAVVSRGLAEPSGAPLVIQPDATQLQ